MLRILLIDDHTLFRQGLKFLLSDLEKNIDFFEANSCERAIALPPGDGVELILLDLNMPGVGGMDALSAMRQAFESAIVVVLSSEDGPAVIRQAIENGAAGFVPKSSTPQVLIAALRLVLAGGTYLPPHVLHQLAAPTNAGSPPRDESAQSGHPPAALSARQLEVLLKAVQGKANKTIAREMNLSDATIKAHLSAAFRVLGVQNRTEAVFVAARLGLSENMFKQG